MLHISFHVQETQQGTRKRMEKLEQDEMKEEDHQIELKEGYEQDEEYEKSKE